MTFSEIKSAASFKYFKPFSLTWWASVVPLVAGLIVATEPMHGLETIVSTIDNLSGGLSGYAMMNIGVGGIGLRGAMK